MAGTAFAIVADVEARWRPLSAAETVKAQSLLSDASSLMRKSVPTIDVFIADTTLDPDDARAVCAYVVIRALQNPENLTRERIDDYEGERSAAPASTLGGLYLTAAEVRMLSPGTSVGGAFTIRPYGAPDGDYLPINWWELNL